MRINKASIYVSRVQAVAASASLGLVVVMIVPRSVAKRVFVVWIVVINTVAVIVVRRAVI